MSKQPSSPAFVEPQTKLDGDGDVVCEDVESSSAESDGYETTDAENEMPHSQMDYWLYLCDAKGPDGKYRTLEDVRAKWNADHELDSNSDTSTSPNLDADVETSKVDVINSGQPDTKENDEVTTRECMILELLTRTSSDDSGDEIDLHSTFLCSECALCKLVFKLRDRFVIGRISPSDDSAGILQFWTRLDKSVNNLYWAALKTQADRGFQYPLTQMLHKGAILRHYLMEELGNRTNFIDFDTVNDVWFSEKVDKVLNAVQVEELRLADALKKVIGHYGKRVYDSDTLAKLEVLDVAENFIKSLRILLKTEFCCRREVLLADSGFA